MHRNLRTALLAAIAVLALAGTAFASQVMIGGTLHQLFVQANPVTGAALIGATPTNRSGTLAAASTSQQVMAANASRRGFMIQNNSSAALWINELGATAALAQPSIQIAAGATYTSPDGAASPLAINIIGGTLGQAFTAREW